MSIVLLPFFGDVFKLLWVNVLLLGYIGWWFFSRAETQRRRELCCLYWFNSSM